MYPALDEFERGRAVEKGTGLPETDPAGAGERLGLLSPLDPAVGPLWKTEDAVEFDNGYGAELFGLIPVVPPVGKTVPVTEAGPGGLTEFAVEFGEYDDEKFDIVVQVGPAAPLPLGPVLAAVTFDSG